MFKVAYVSTVDGLKEARGLLKRIYDENPSHWPNGLTPDHFDGGLYLVREASCGKAVGFCGWQERNEIDALKQGQLKESGSRLEPHWDNLFKSLGCRHVKTGYYSIGILPEYRNNGFAKEALKKLISVKSAGVDRVKALIMSSNAPSLALADSLGVEKIVKRGNTMLSRLGGSLSRMFRSPASGGLMGPEVAAIARRKGVQMHMPSGWFNMQPTEEMSVLGKKVHLHKLLNQVLSPMGLAPKFVLPGETPTAGVLLSPTGTRIPKAMQRAVDYAEPAKPFPFAPHGDVDKLREAQMLAGFIPETESAGRFARGLPRNSGKAVQMFRDRLTKRLGPNWILKPRSGFASAPGSMLTDATSMTPQQLRTILKNPHIAQQRHVMEQVGPIRGAADKLLTKISPDFFGNVSRGTREYRIHTMGGKVVPYATYPRGSSSEYLMANLNPFRTKRIQQVEDYVQEALNHMPENVRKVGYGFDVGIDRFGRPFVIEANPAVGGNASGFVSLPGVGDAYAAAVKGTIPRQVKLRNSLYGLGLLGAGAAYTQQPEQSRFQRVREAFLQ